MSVKRSRQQQASATLKVDLRAYITICPVLEEQQAAVGAGRRARGISAIIGALTKQNVTINVSRQVEVSGRCSSPGTSSKIRIELVDSTRARAGVLNDRGGTVRAAGPGKVEHGSAAGVSPGNSSTPRCPRTIGWADHAVGRDSKIGVGLSRGRISSADTRRTTVIGTGITSFQVIDTRHEDRGNVLHDNGSRVRPRVVLLAAPGIRTAIFAISPVERTTVAACDVGS